jgi:3-hydroxyisobutyrate dehydrogenase
VLETAGRALGGGDRPAVWAQMSTLGLDGTERCAALASERGVALVDAPVLGTKQPAEAGELIVLAAGPDDAVARCAPVFDAIGKHVVRLGEAGEATRLKLVLNHWILGIVENVAETMQLAEALGVDPALWLETIGGGPLDLPYAQLKGKAILERSLEPSFRLALAHKDAGLVLEAASRHQMQAALIEVVAERMARAIDAGHGDEDMAATYFGR